MRFDVIVIGGGAAGLFCARSAGRRGRRVLLLERNGRLGNKILISGGGRCNFTNLEVSAANYVTRGSPHFPKSALARFTPQDFLALVEHHGIAWHEKKLGQLFCDHSSKQILQLLEDECAHVGVAIRTDCRVESVACPGGNPAAGQGSSPSLTTDPNWQIVTSAGSFETRSLVIATGGLSFPKLGATPFGYDIARQFGVTLVTARPGLVPLTLAPTDLTTFGELSGLSLECITTAGDPAPAFRENILFTHRGLSGPAILQVSNYWQPGSSVHLNLLPGQDPLEFFAAHRAGGREIKAALRHVWPERFAQAWCARNAPAGAIAQLPRRELEVLAEKIRAWQITPAGDEGYPKAEVTLGGVDTGELSSKTMECRRVPGLHFIGEVVDVTGWLGGYNFQWAWASGHAAGQAV